MKSIYLRNFVATATMVALCFLIVAVAFVGIGRSFVLDEYQDTMEKSADEIARVASAMGESEDLTSWALRLNLSSISNSTGNHISLTDRGGCIVSCSEGLAAVAKDHPDVPIYTACVDRQLNSHNYILPGLGDAGDRLFGTK